MATQGGLLQRMVGGKRHRRGIGLVEVHGEIVPFLRRPLGIFVTPGHMRDLFEHMKEDDGVRAAIVSVNSPGGALVASREIARTIETFPKPTVAWIRDVGASGGYEVASACRKVVADELSLVGSVGVILPHIEVSRLLDKVGVAANILKAGRYKDMGGPFRPLAEDERVILQGELERAQQGFLQDVARRRHLTEAAKDEIRTALTFFGEKAMALGLVDKLGGYDEAVRVCEELGGFTHDEVVPFKHEPAGGLLGRVLEWIGGGGGGSGSGLGGGLGEIVAAVLSPGAWLR